MNKINTMKYLAINFKYKGKSLLETDCYGLCKIIAQERKIKLPNVNYKEYHMRQTHFLIQRHCENTKLWNKVKPKIDTIVAFRLDEVISHVGYMINETEFIHIRKNVGVRVDNINDPLWQLQIVGYYEYIGN